MRLRVRATRGRLTFFRKMVQPPDAPPGPGAIVEVRDRDAAFVGRGFYHPRSEIAVRILSLDPDGPCDDTPVRSKLRAAVEFRHDVLRLPQVADAYRVCHAEGDGLSGLVVDRLGPVLSIELFSLAYFERLARIREWLLELFPGARFSARADEEIQRIEGFRLPPPEDIEGIVVREYGVEYRIDLAHGHKTGFFCDQRENRREFARLAAGRDVLDLCTCTGGFAIAAARAGARGVTAIELDERALDLARRNAKLNRVKVEFLHADLFNYLRQVRRSFGAVVIDPPKMASTPAEVPRARRAYHDMNALAMKALEPGGLLLSCSCTGLVGEPDFLEILRAAARTAGRTLQTFRIAGAGPDHPVSSLHPEGRYLKAVYSRVL